MPTAAPPSVRLEVAWTVAASAIGGGLTYGSAVLHAVAQWPESPVSTDTSGSPDWSPVLDIEVQLISGASVRPVRLADVSARTQHSGAWAHVELRSAGAPLLAASFHHGRLIYCTSDIPGLAGLGGGTYDAPSGTLDVTSI